MDDVISSEQLRVLVAIASYGERNIEYLRRLVDQCRSMNFFVDVVVLGNVPKDLSGDVAVQVGPPSPNPWSLPFAHKPLFAENVDRYDLFIYSEDDIDVSEDAIRAFVRATAVLREDEIAGFLRYETDSAGNAWMPDAHGVFHWDPNSVVERGGMTFARYTNEHAAFFVITRQQLKRAIASGGFMTEPYEGKYDMVCAAATSPYTARGLRKLVCISDLRRFLVHHMSNRYAGRVGLPLSDCSDQVSALTLIQQGRHPAANLCSVESKLARAIWSRDFFERPSEDVIAMVPRDARRILSVGCGWGQTEKSLQQRGCEVVAVPLDSVIGAAATRAAAGAGLLG